MKPFSLGRAKAGDAFGIVKNILGEVDRVRLVGELTDGRIVVERHASSGVYCAEVFQEDQLRMFPTKRTFWVNLMAGGPAAWFGNERAAQMAEHTYQVVARAVCVEVED